MDCLRYLPGACFARRSVQGQSYDGYSTCSSCRVIRLERELLDRWYLSDVEHKTRSILHHDVLQHLERLPSVLSSAKPAQDPCFASLQEEYSEEDDDEDDDASERSHLWLTLRGILPK